MAEKKILFSEHVPGKGLEAALSRKPSEVIDEVKTSGLKGRGGAGFPTGLKWQFTAIAPGEEKYIICNADEGEPGTFKDRVLLTEQADKLLEGMAIAGYAVGAQKGFIYLRAEYRWMRKDVERGIEAARKAGLLGSKIGGKDFAFDVEIRMGAGAYICGEETALIESMEGKRGEPRNRPPYPAAEGFRNKPTVVNNVETFCTIPHIMVNGGEWFKGFGTGPSAGMKLFSISGDVEKPGVYELPLGITVNQILDLVGGKDAQAAQIGGASGMTVPARDFERKIAYEDLPPGGSIVVFGKNRNMIHILKNLLEFFVHESCGQCTPCREGNRRLLEATVRMEKAPLDDKELDKLIGLSKSMGLVAKCGLGQTSSNPFANIVTNFVRPDAQEAK